jgi:hypothetical protein
MTKYKGSITVVDDEGNAIFEKELSTDEIVEALLSAIPDAEDDATEEEPGEPVRTERKCGGCGKSGHSRRTCSKSDAERPAPKGKPCCGSLGARHKKDCQETGQPDELPPPAPEDKGRMLTTDEFDRVKEMRNDQEMTSQQIASELELPLPQVNYALVTTNFDAYRKHYEYQNT